MEIVHIHRKLLGCYCLALRVRRGGWDKQQMTNVQNCKWVSGNLLRRGQVSRLCCTLQYVLWTVREARLRTISPGAEKPDLWTKRHVTKDWFWFGFFLFLFLVCLSSCWLSDCQVDSENYLLNQRISNFSKAWYIFVVKIVNAKTSNFRKGRTVDPCLSADVKMNYEANNSLEKLTFISQWS